MTDQSAYEALLAEICTDLGFCGSLVGSEPRHVDMFIPASGPVSAQEFVAWVFMAEGMDPDSSASSKHAPKILEAFVRHLGSEVVDAQALK